MPRHKDHTERCSFDIHQYEWYSDKNGRTWVVVQILYDNGIKDSVALLELGKSSPVMLSFEVVKTEIEAKRMNIFFRL